MDEPTKPGSQDTSKGSWPEDSGSEGSFGATGIFGTVKSQGPTERPAARTGIGPDALGNRAQVNPKPPTGLGAMDVAEPVVHKVVFGGGAANPSTGGRSADGLDELLRSLGNETRSPSGGPKEMPAPDPPQAGPSSGFTSLLQKLGTPETPKAPAEDLRTPVQPAAVRTTPEEPKSAPAPSGTGGFTELFKAIPGGVSNGGQRPEARPSPREPMSTPAPAGAGGFTELFKAIPGGASDGEQRPEARPSPREPVSAPAPAGAGGFTELFRAMPAEAPQSGQSQNRRPGEDPISGAGTPAAQAPVDNSGGTFTKLFGTFGGASASPAAPAFGERKTEAPASRSAGSFTEMFSVDQQGAGGQPSYREERGAPAGSLDFGPSGGKSGAAPGRDPFAEPLPEAQPVEGTPSGSGVGITRLIRMLDGPSTAPAPRMDSPLPVAPPSPAGAGVWTQTFATMGGPNEPAAPAAKTPEWTPTQPPPASSSNEPALSAPAPPSAKAGPSEYTRILDASRMREMAMRGGQAAGAASPNPAPPAQSFAPPAVAMPSYAAPAVPQMGGMQQPGGFPPPQPPQVPSYPMNLAPQAGAMPQQPGMHVPVPQMPAAPPAPQVKPPEPGVGKLQQYVPLLLVVIIVLLVVILVTVVFLMKH